MADITGYVLDASLTGYIYNIPIYGAVAQFSISGLSVGVSKLYVDGSLATRDASITFLYNNIQPIQDYIKSASTGYGLYWNNGLLDVSVEGGTGVSKLYVDSSLITRDASITFLYDSIQPINAKIDYLDACLGVVSNLVFSINTSLNFYATNSSVNNALLTNASLGALSTASVVYNSSIGWLDASVKAIFPLTYKTNSSIGTLTSRHNVTESSLGTLTSRHNITEASLGNLTSTVSTINTSIGWLDASVKAIFPLTYKTNSSIGWLDASIKAIFPLVYTTNTSLGDLTLRHNVTESSLGTLTSRHNITEASLGVETQKWIDINRNGFFNQTDTSISFNPTTYVFTLSGTNWKYMRAGVEYIVPGDVSVLLPGTPPTAGTYYIAIQSNNGTLSQSNSSWTLLDTTIPVAILNFNSDNNPQYLLAEERHSMLIDRRDHWYNHFTRGTQFVSGGQLSGPTVSGADSSDNCFGVAITVIADEDIISTLPALARPSTDVSIYKIAYRTGPSTYTWKMSMVPYTYSPTYIEWDNNGTMTAGGATEYYNTYLLFTNEVSAGRFTILPGRGEYSTLARAQAENPITFDFTGFPIAEAVIAWQFTWNTRPELDNLGKCRLAAAPKRINIGVTSNPGSGGAISHNSLAGLQGGTVNEFYHLTNTEYAALSSYATNSSVNLAFLTNTSLGNLTTSVSIIDASLNNLNIYVDEVDNLIKATYIPDSSLNQSTFKWVGGYLEPSIASGTGDVTKAYVDGSLGMRDVSILWLNDNKIESAALNSYATNASVNLAFLTNASLGKLSLSSVTYNSSIGTLTSRLNITDSSLNTLLNRHNITESSLGNISTRLNTTDSSLNTLLGRHNITEVSVGAMYSNSRIDASFATKAAVNASIGAMYSNIRIDASFALKTWVLQSDTSVSLMYSNSRIDASFATKAAVNASIGAMYTNSQIDASFAFKKGFNIISVSTNAPASPGVYDLWIDTSIA